MFQVDEAIAKVENLYRQLTGSDPKKSETPFAPIPPEVDAQAYVQENFQRLEMVMQHVGPVGRQTSPTPSVPSVAPRIQVLEDDKSWTCQVDLPGVAKSDVSVKLAQGALHVLAMRRPAIEGGQRPVYSETMPCRFERAVPLPLFVKEESAQAKLKGGMLQIQFQKDPAGGRREIDVAVG